MYKRNLMKNDKLWSILAIIMTLTFFMTNISVSTVKAFSLKNEIVFIDSSVKDADIIAEGVKTGTEVIMLDKDKDGVNQVSEILKKKNHVDSIHIISHGDSGKLYLGTAVLSLDNFEKYTMQLNIIKNALNDDGKILLYGCNVAKGTEGLNFINKLAKQTGAVIAASNNITGSSNLGGDWKLEARTGAIEDNNILSVLDYPHILATTYTFSDFIGISEYGMNSASAPYKDLTITAWDMENVVSGSPMPTAIYNNGYLWVSGEGWSMSAGSVHKLTIQKADGSTFTPSSVDVSISTYSPNSAPPYETDTFRVYGYDGTGKVIASQTFSGVYTGSTVNVNFATFTNISKLEFSLDYNDFGIGNLVIGPLNHTVTFKDYDGTTIGTPQSIADGGSATAPESPSRTGYVFTGWDKTFNNVTQDLVVTAQYDRIPTVNSINRAASSPTNASSISYTVTFSESVTGVDTSDFTLTSTGTVTGTIASISGSGSTYTVTVNGITGDGTLRLDLNSSGTGIVDSASNAITSGYTTGEIYTIDTTIPAAVTGITLSDNDSNVGIDGRDFTIGFTDSTDDPSDVANYKIYIYKDGEAPADITAFSALASGSKVAVKTITATASTDGVASNLGSGVTTDSKGQALATGDYWVVVITTDSIGNYSFEKIASKVRITNDVLPTATTVTATNIGQNTATLNGSVNDNGTDTTISFEYGLTTGYGSTATATPGSLSAGAGATSVSASLSGLTANTTYYFRVKAVNGVGTTNAVGSSFTTSPGAPGAPTIGTATAGDAQASVSFTAPTSDGGSAITGYTVTATPVAGGTSITGTGTSSPITVTGLTNGTAYTFTVTATNSAGTGAASAASNTATPKGSQTITFLNPGAQNFGTSPTLTATATSGLTVTFSSGDTTVATITPGGTITFLKAGTAVIYADQAGNGTYLAATTVTQNFIVNAVVPGAPTIGTATAGDTQASVTFTAPASNGGTAVTGYTVTATPAAGGTSITAVGMSSPITVTGLTNGTAYTFTVTATNSAGIGAASAASNSATPKGSQTITFTNPGAQNFGTSPTLTATATSGLTVTFSSGDTTVATITPGGTITFLKAGTAVINADQAGNGTYLAATTITRSFTVNAVVPGAPTIGTATAGDAQASVTFTAPTSNGGAAITGYTVTATPAAGGTSITAVGMSSPITVTGLTNGTAYTFTVTATNSAGTGSASAASNSATPKGSQTITFSNPGSQSFGTSPTLTATATSGLTVTFSSGDTTVATITPGGTITFLKAGTAVINADQAGNGTYLAATTITRSFTVNAVVPGAPTIGTATAGNKQATVNFTAPTSNGGAAITGYTVTATPAAGGTSITAAGTVSPITVTGLTNGTAYTFTVKATNSAGTGAASAASNQVTPIEPVITGGGGSTTTPTTVTGSVIDDKTGETVKGVEAQVTTAADGTKTVAVKSEEAILFKQPDGTNNSLTDTSKLSFSAPVTTDTGTAAPKATVTLKEDGTIQVSGLPNGSETKFAVTMDLGNGQKIVIGTMDVKVSSNGDVNLTSTLIDPYGTITDAATGKIIDGAKVTLYYANTDRNKANGKVPDTIVSLPLIDGFKPNNNANPQISDLLGAYGFMVFPTTDYYIVAVKDGYEKYTSPTISVEQEIVKWDFKMNKTAAPKPVTTITRLAGAGRVDTALEIAKASYSGKLSNVVLATAENYPDALAGSVLAYKLNAPILLVGSSDAEQQKVLDYISANLDKAGTVYILGGTGAVSAAMENKIAANGFVSINRISGADRYETSARIVDAMHIAQGTPIVLVSGENYPDALSVSSAAALKGYPILLVKPNEIPANILNEISYIRPSSIYIIGLQGAVNTAAESKAAEAAGLNSDTVIRIGGADRYETSLSVAKYFNLGTDNICIATGNNFPDALAGSAYAAKSNAAIMLVDNTLTDSQKAYLQGKQLLQVTIFGGEGAVNSSIQQQLQQLYNK